MMNLEDRIAANFNSVEAYNEKLSRELAKLHLPILERYHRVEYHGLKNIPAENRPFVAVGNQGGVHFTPEVYLWLAKYRAQGYDRTMLLLINTKIHSLLRRLQVPVNGLGLLDDTPESAIVALESGCSIATYPGGDLDASKSFFDRHKIDFHGSIGYVRAALACGAPILPIVTCGGGETTVTISNGEAIAERFGLSRFLDVHTWPVFWSFPYGLHAGHRPHMSIPLPSKLKLSVLPPIITSDMDPKDADNPEVVRNLDKIVRGRMQDEMDRLAKWRIPVIG